MHAKLSTKAPRKVVVAVAGIGIALATGSLTLRADDRKENDQGFLSRLFRPGTASGRSSGPARPAPHPRSGMSAPDAPAAPGRLPNGLVSPSNPPTPLSNPFPGQPNSGPSTPDLPTGSEGPRLVPQPRVARPVTEAEPLISRVMIGRTDTGSQFGMFLQVFSDGTVIDTEGVHRVDRELLRPLVLAMQAALQARVQGHCGSPSADFVQSMHVIMYERTMGRLRAQTFSYSGNPQGCDASIAQVHAALEAIQAKLSGQPTVANSARSPQSTSPSPLPINSPAIPLTSGGQP